MTCEEGPLPILATLAGTLPTLQRGIADRGEGVVERDRGDVHQPGLGRAAEQVVEDDVQRVGVAGIVDRQDVAQDIAGIGAAVTVLVAGERLERGGAIDDETYWHDMPPNDHDASRRPPRASRYMARLWHGSAARTSG